jgi:hypothetical protein
VNIMQSNYTLRQAVITALTILAMGAQNQALALGLGNIDVNSHLGQPLRASIKVQGASELKDSTCFKVINDSSAENQLNSANFKLSNVVDDVAILTITTKQIINEPITNLSVLAECDANMRRDYVLLLDPPLTTEAENTFVEEATMVEEIAAVESPIASKTQPQSVKTPSASTKKSSAKKQKLSKKSNANIVLTAGYDVEKPAETANDSSKNKVEKETQPRLSISSGDASNIDLNSPKLRLDTQLHFTPETAPQALASETDVQDEATVMSHRLAHLEKQLNSLAQANLTLKTENQLKTQQLAEAENSKMDWLGYILGGGLLLSSISIADKWLRRRQIQQLQDAQLAWANNSEATNNLDDFETNDNFFEAQPAANSAQQLNQIVDNANDSAAPVVEMTPFSVEEFNDEHNVLDHADVFLSHGRTSLAIQLLQNHLLDHPKQSVTIWLFLLDLIAKENMQAAYEQTALECKEHFNIRIAAFSNDEASEKKTFEDFPRLYNALQEIWGTPAAIVFLDDLIYNSRLETRIGFEKTVLEELLLLKNIAHDAMNTAEVIQLDEKKLAMKELKEAQIAAKKAEKLEMMDELAISDVMKKQASAEQESKEAMFEFSLVERN